MGGKERGASGYSQPVLLPEQKRIWDFLTTQLIPQALGQETAATQIGTQRARDEGARLAAMQQNQVQQLATQGIGSGQRATLLSQAQNAALQNTLQQILAQRQAAQQRALQMLQGLPLQPGQQKVERGYKGLSVGQQLGKFAGEKLIEAGASYITKPQLPGT